MKWIIFLALMIVAGAGASLSLWVGWLFLKEIIKDLKKGYARDN